MHQLRLLHLIATLVLLAISLHAQGSDLEQHLRDQYRGKTLVLRNFYSPDNLLYDPSGALIDKQVPGDWTEDGFAIVDDVHVSGSRVAVEARRRLIVSSAHMFQFRAAEQPTADKKGMMPVALEITVNFGSDPSAEQADAVMSKIFLTAQDDLSELLPDYWKSCVSSGLTHKNDQCMFSPEVLTVPGVAASGNSYVTPATSRPSSTGPAFRVGGGVSPPRVTYDPNPEFSERARQAKYQGVVTLGLVVNQQGVPTNIHILAPLGCGLDAKAVEKVGTWRFEPAEKDGQPVRVMIAVEVNFALY
jgi:TonB family protein